MSGQLRERQDHVVYGLWIGLVLVALSLGIGHQIGALAQMLQGVRGGTDWSAVVVAFGAYFVFRLVRPFPFTSEDSAQPAGLLYWLGTFVVTLASAGSALFLSTAVVQVEVLAQHRSAAMVLGTATIAGFMLVEASLARESSKPGPRAVCLDSGLVSALLILPACAIGFISWFVSASPSSGLGQLFLRSMVVDSWRVGFPLALGGGTFVLWWISRSVRDRLRRSTLYRSAVGALWVFGLAAYAMSAVQPWAAVPDADGEGILQYLWTLMFLHPYLQPGVFLLGLLALWAIVAGVMFIAQRTGRPA